MDNDPINSQQYQNIDDITRQYMHLTYADERMNYQTSYVTNEPFVRDPYIAPRRVQRLHTRAGRQLHDEADPAPSSMHDMGGPSSAPNMGTSTNVPFSGLNVFGDMNNQDYYTPQMSPQSHLNLFNQPSDIFRGSLQMSPHFDHFNSHMERSSFSPVPFDWDINTVPNLGNDDTVVGNDDTVVANDEDEGQEAYTEYNTEVNEQRNIARDRGRRRIVRPSCGTHQRR